MTHAIRITYKTGYTETRHASGRQEAKRMFDLYESDKAVSVELLQVVNGKVFVVDWREV